MHLHESELEVDYQLTTAEDFAENNGGRFDIVTCLEMLEHVPDPGSVIDAATRLLKPDGLMFLSTINRNPNRLRSALSAPSTCSACYRAAPTSTAGLSNHRKWRHACAPTVCARATLLA